MVEVLIFLVGAVVGFGTAVLIRAFKRHAEQLEAEAKETAKRQRALRATQKRAAKAAKAATPVAVSGGTDSSLYGRKNGAAGEQTWPAQ